MHTYRAMDQIPSPIPSPAAYEHLQQPKLLASLYNQGFLHPALRHQYGLPHGLHHGLSLLDDPFRPRSGSLLSLGSTGSSHRPERSPSRESTSSHDSLTRASPLPYIPESPSPSPPNEASKLFGLLKGTVQSPYNNLFHKQIVHRAETMRRPGLDALAMRKQSGFDSLDEAPKKPIPAPELLKRSFTLRDPPLKRTHGHDDGPMDLSCKPKRPRVDSMSPVRKFPPPSETVTRSSLQASSAAEEVRETKVTQPVPRQPPALERIIRSPVLEPISPPSRAPSRDSVASMDESSILRSILVGGASGMNNGNSSSESGYPSRPASVRSDVSGGMCPPSPALSEPASPSNSILSRLMAGSPCNVEANQRVGIAKKTLLPVRARVTYWLVNALKFVKSLPEFSSLCEKDQVILVTNTWAKLLLLYMAENNFEFAVSPVVEVEGERLGEGGNPEVPTMKSVEGLQGFVHKCHTMAMDATEYTLFKTAVLFQTGNTGLADKSQVEKANNSARESLQKHVQDTHPADKLRYSSILLRHHAISGINSKMIQNLFCKHITSKVSMDAYLKDLLFEQAPVSATEKK